MSRPNKLLWNYTFILAVFCAMVFGTSPAQANLMIMPIYAVFGDRDRTADITLLNTDEREITYRLSWVYQKQNEDSSYTIQEGPINPALDFGKSVYFSPRQVTLPPNGKQNIRLSLRRPADLPEGEYHAHLRIQGKGSPGSSESQIKNSQGGVAVELSINTGFAIPVFIRVGKYNATAKISDPQFISAAKPNEMPKFEFFLNRTGVHGTMGKVEIFWAPPGGEEKQIGLLNNVNVFSERERRLVRVPLREKSIPAGTIRVVYEGVGPDKGITFDEKTFPVGG